MIFHTYQAFWLSEAAIGGALLKEKTGQFVSDQILQ